MTTQDSTNFFLVKWLDRLVFYYEQCKPIYSHAKGQALKSAIEKVPYSVAITDKKNELYKASKAVIPQHIG
jgi:hypothetical protein